MTGALFRTVLRWSMLAGLLAVVLIPLRDIPTGIETQAQLEVSNMDEAAMVYRIMGHLERGDLDPRGEFNYGAFYPTVATGVLAGLETLGVEATEKRIALTCRLISWLGYLGLLAVVFAILRRVRVSVDVSLLSVLLLASGPDLYYWAQHIHPDVPQAFLIALAFWIVARGQAWRWAVLAAFVCGVAFGTKYSGLFAVGFVLLPALSFGAERSARRVSIGLASSAIAFLAGWLLFNPYVLASPTEFWRDLQFERIHVGFGHYVAEPRNPLLWLSIWFDESRPFGVWLVAAGLALAVWFLFRRPEPISQTSVDAGDTRLLPADDAAPRFDSANRRFLRIVLGYVVASILYLGTAVVMRRMRYSFHFWPLLFVLVGFGLDRGLEMLRGRNRAIAQGGWSVAVACGLVLAISTAASRGSETAGVEDPIFAAAEWVAQQYRPATPIVADAYFYRHPHFENLRVVPGVKPDDLIEHEAFVVVLLERTSGRWSWKEPGTRFEDHRFRLGARVDAEAVQQFHRELTSPTSPYRVVYETDSVVVLELKPEVFESEPPAAAAPAAPDSSANP